MGLRVFFSREITIKVFGNSEKRTCDHGEGALRALPPLESNPGPMSLEDDIVLDFEGELRCTDDVTSPGFSNDILAVKVC